MTNPDFSSFFCNLAFLKDNILSIVNNINVIPRGYSNHPCKTYKNCTAKIYPQDSDPITLWGVYIPPPFESLRDMNLVDHPKTPYNKWVNLFQRSSFTSKFTLKGHWFTDIMTCHTCKAIDHSYLMCPIHNIHEWKDQYPRKPS